jgi:diguanylate cyclase (GGDEF)-like protein/PAS domain S-box-containing protein
LWPADAGRLIKSPPRADNSAVTAFQYTPFILPLVVSALVLLALLYVTWRNRTEQSAPWFAATLIALLVWTVGYIFELTAVALQAKIHWADVQYIGTTALPLLLLELVLIYTRGRGLRRAAFVALAVACAAIVVMIFVNPGDLFRVNPALATHGSLVALEPDYGALWEFVWIPWAYILFFVVALILVRGMMHTRRIHVGQYAALLVATLIPLVGGSLYALGMSPWPAYNPAMALVSVSGLLMGYALFHYRLFDVAPLARDAVIEGLADGLVVLDLESRLRDFNPAARHVFPSLNDDAIGRPVSEVLAIHPAMLEGLHHEAETANDDGPRALMRADISIAVPEEGHEGREFTLVLTPVRTAAGRVVGHALTLHDVTESAELMARLGELSSRDELTGLLSRHAWQEQGDHELVRAVRYGYGLGLVVLDLDGLQRVNNAYGQATGDAVLRALAVACRHSLRPFDLVGRLGSDEVGVVLPHLTAAETVEAGLQLRDAVGRLRVPAGADVVQLTACVGVACIEHSATELLPALLHQAEAALGAARAQGPGQVACAWDC